MKRLTKRITPTLSRQRQEGIATVLIVVLLGLSLTITALVGLSKLRSAQEFGVSMHTQTVTQQRAWSAGLALREYLQQVTAVHSDWIAFFDSFDLVNAQYPTITMSGFEGLQAQFIAVDDTDPEHIMFSVALTAETAPNTRAASKSTLQMTYAVEPPTPSDSGQLQNDNNVFNFYDGLDISGNIEALVDLGDQYDVFVDGNVKISGVSIRGFDTIKSTKSIHYQGGSGGDFRELHASCDVFVSNVGGFTIESIRATNNVCVQNTANTLSIAANGFASVTGGSHNLITSLADRANEASCATGSQVHCSGNNYGVDVGWSTTASKIETKGEIRSREARNVVSWRAEDKITFDSCPSPMPDAVSKVNVTAPGYCNITPNINPGMDLEIPEVEPVTLERVSFDANLLRESANYIYYRHNGTTRVLVRDVDGIPSHDHLNNPQEVRDYGYYHRTSNTTNKPNYACRHSTSNNDSDNCWLLSTNFNNKNVHPSYTQNNQRWTLDGVSHAPGVVFFEGNLTIKNGHYTNTFISTGSITLSSSNNSVAAPNYIGENTKTIEVPDYGTYTYQGVCNNTYGLKPKDFCKPRGFDYTTLSGIGNFSLMAGSCPPSSPGQCQTNQYVGGDIAIAGPVLGAIKAGNIFSTSGQTRIEGYVSALALRGTGTTNKIGNKTVIDLSNLPQGYDPTGGAISGGSDNGGNNGGQQEATPGSATLRWSRYL